MIDERVKSLLNQISDLEDELRTALSEQQEHVLYRIEGKRIEFEQGIREAQEKLRKGLPGWLAESQLRNIVTAPVIYSMIVPLALLDFGLSVYQKLCFPLYRVCKVERSHYMMLDRFQLPYLNSIERLNCAYCGYAAGVIAYAREIAARTEQYWCPIKHAHKMLDPHRTYARYADFGDGEHYHEIHAAIREDLQRESEAQS